MGKIYFFCHGQSEANKDKIFAKDSPLTDRGKLQAIRASNYFKSNPVEVVLSGTTLCSFVTALLAFPSHKRIITDRRFDHISFGMLDTLPVTNFVRKNISSDPTSIKTKYHGDDIEARAMDALKALYDIAKRVDYDVVLVSDDSLMEYMLYKIGFITEAIEKEKEFQLWSSARKIDNCRAMSISTSSFIQVLTKILEKSGGNA